MNDTNPRHLAPSGTRRVASDRLEHRRGQRDGQLGRAPASIGRAYLSGYAAGRGRGPGRTRASDEGPRRS